MCFSNTRTFFSTIILYYNSEFEEFKIINTYTVFIRLKFQTLSNKSIITHPRKTDAGANTEAKQCS
jgi:hypothetical protein